jgi:hypothetical protein
MLRTILVSAALLAWPVALAAHPHDAPKSALVLAVETEVLATRDLIQKAALDKNVPALKKLLAEEFTHTHGSGKVDGRDARILSLIAGEPVIELASVTDRHVHVHGGTTAIVTGLSPILNTKENRSYDFRWMQVYVKGAQGWQLVASQATRLPVPASN